MTLGFKVNPLKIDAALVSELRNLALGQIHLEVSGPSDFCIDGRLRLLSGLPIAALDLSGMLVNSKGLKNLRELPNLNDLDLSRNFGERDNIRDVGLAELRDLPLTKLNLQGRENITHAGLEVLRNMPLSSLNLRDCRNVDDECLAILQGLPLTQLDVSNLTRPSLEGLRVLSELPGLVDLSISQWCRGVFSWGLPLTKLCITDCSLGSLGDLRGLPQLVNLCLVGRDRIVQYPATYARLENVGLYALEGLSLVTFSVHNIHYITDAGLEVLRGMSSLKWMYFYECPRITAEGLATFGRVEVEGAHVHAEL